MISKGISALDYIRLDRETGLKVGALCSHRAIEKSAVVRDKFGILAEMELNLASVQTRNWGTIGGNLCRCTGYVKIVEAVLAAGEKIRA